MAKIFCVANQKGGVGKTTTAVNLAASLAALDQRVLLVDLDPQGNATMGSGIDKAAVREHRLRRAGRRRDGARSAQRARKRSATTSCRPTVNWRAPKSNWSAWKTASACCARRLAEVEADYDFILIDCPPALSLLTLNGLCAAHGVIIPMQCEYFALEGLSDLVNTIKQVHANLNRDLKVIGLLRVMFDPRITLQQQVSDQLKQHFGDKVFDVVIPAQRASGRSAQLRFAGRRVRPGVAWRAGVYPVRHGNDRARARALTGHQRQDGRTRKQDERRR